MAKKPKVQILSRGAVAIMKGSATRGLLEQKTGAVAARAGEGFESGVVWGRDRLLGFVRAETVEAMRAESEDRALTRALDAAR